MFVCGIWISLAQSSEEQGGILCSILCKFGSGKMVDSWLCYFSSICEQISIYFKTNALPTVTFLPYWLLKTWKTLVKKFSPRYFQSEELYYRKLILMNEANMFVGE